MDPLVESSDKTQVLEKKKSPLYPDLKDGENDENETRRELLAAEEGGEAKTEEKEEEARKVPVVLAVLAISFGSYIHGTSIVFPDTALAGIRSSSLKWSNSTNSTELGYQYDDTKDRAWIMGIAAWGMVAGGLLTGPLINGLGRRFASILGIAIVFALSYTFFLIATHVYFLIVARFLAGFGLGISQAVSTVYISEVSTPSLRSTMAVVPAMTGCLGVYTCQLLAFCLPWQTLAAIFAGCNIPFLCMCLAMPESPSYLVSKGKVEQAHSVLRRLRGPRWNVTKEVAEITRSLQTTCNPNAKKVSFGDWLDPTCVRPLIIAFALMFFFQMSGINLMLMFAITIFGQVGQLDAFLSQILVGSALFASNTLTLIIAGKLPRRVMLLTCSLGLSATLAIMGLCYQIDDWEKNCKTEIENLNECERRRGFNVTDCSEENLRESCSYGLGLLPIITAMVYIFMFNIGYGSLVWMTATEILPAKIRSSTNGLTVGWTGVMSFLTTFSFPFMLDSSLGGQGCFWIYSAVSFLGFVFIASAVPETSGKTEAEISMLFQKKADNTPEEESLPTPILKCTAGPKKFQE